MSNFSAFMKKNKVTKENVKFPVTKSLTDENGNPLLWELKPLTTRENEALRDACTKEIPVKGKPGQYRVHVDTVGYMAKMVCASVVYPDLSNKDLQDSYGVMTPEDLLKEMVDDPGEYSDLLIKIQELSGFKSLSDEVDEAKN